METLYKAGIIVALFSIVTGNCPVQETIAPCECRIIEDGISVRCKGPEDVEGIASAIENLENITYLELVLETLVLPILPSSMSEMSALHLYNVHIQKMQNNSSVKWPKLSEVVIESSSISDTLLPYFKEAHLLRHLEIGRIEIPTIGSEFKESIPTGVTYLYIRKTKTTILEPQALSHLKKLQYLTMVDIPLQEFSRNVLPKKMPDLCTFILGNTKIEKLEAEFFDGMPKLEIIMMNGNKLTTLDHGLFAPVENQLTHLLAERNPLICDCNLLWLTNNAQKQGSLKVLATCNDNATKEIREITSLDENEYCS